MNYDDTAAIFGNERYNSDDNITRVRFAITRKHKDKYTCVLSKGETPMEVIFKKDVDKPCFLGMLNALATILPPKQVHKVEGFGLIGRKYEEDNVKMIFRDINGSFYTSNEKFLNFYRKAEELSGETLTWEVG